jgi:hypothetical protein
MTDDRSLDGNVAAGSLRTYFSVDVTAALGQCDHCGRVGPLAETQVYLPAPGIVLRCRGCDGVLLRIVEAPGRAWLDMRGLRVLQIGGPGPEVSASPGR